MKCFVNIKKILNVAIFVMLFEQHIGASSFHDLVAYGDEYGPIGTTYSMGDYMSGIVNSNNQGFATYYPNVGDQFDYIKDANTYGLNTGNLFNALGMLYAGWATFNLTDLTTNTNSTATHTKKHWLTTYRQAGGGSRTWFDNSNNARAIALFDTSKQPTTWPAVYWTISAPGDVNINNWNMFGQYFGARIAHVLGAVVNDVPSTVASTTPLMQSGRPKPQMAVMTGASNSVPAGLTTPSTAQFGTMQNFLSTGLSISPSASSTIKLAGNYLKSHILQTVQRLASVCKYEMSPTNFIHMTRENIGTITPYDQGVIVAIQNNTGDQLKVNQVSAASSNQVGILNAADTSNHFLHTASLMPVSTAAGSQDPVPGNMIEIADDVNGSSAYVQMVTAKQLKGLITSLNAVLNTLVAGGPSATEEAFAYNQKSGASASFNPAGQYLLITNFNTSTLSSSSVNTQELLMYRMQAVDISQLDGVPFTVTLQINNEKSILYPSIVSCKQLILQNPYDKNRSIGGNTYYCGIPPLLIPESIINSGISGLKAYYGIWFLSYISALTECMYQGSFGDRLGYMQNPIGLFDFVNQQPPARVVIDVSGNLASGTVLPLSISTVSLQTQLNTATSDLSTKEARLIVITIDPSQAESSYEHEDLTNSISVFKQQINSIKSMMMQSRSLMGCDVIDIGSNYHHDIPILNLYTDTKSGSAVANKQGGDWINLSITFGNPVSLSGAPTTFAQGYGLPYNNVMLFSLPAADMKDGVIGELSQISVGNYEITFTDQNSKVLASAKVFLDASIQNPTSMKIQFLNNTDTGWTSSTLIPSTVASVGAGKIKKFELFYKALGTTNTLNATVYSEPVLLTSFTTLELLQQALKDAGIPSLPTVPAAATENPLTYININIGSNIGYAFFSNPWGRPQVVPGFDFTDIAQSDWQAGVQVILLGLDDKGGIISDLTLIMPKTMMLFVYNLTGTTLLKTVQFDPLKYMGIPGNVKTFDTNKQQFGCRGFISGVGSYPQTYVIKCPKPKVIKQTTSISKSALNVASKSKFVPIKKEKAAKELVATSSATIATTSVATTFSSATSIVTTETVTPAAKAAPVAPPAKAVLVGSSIATTSSITTSPATTGSSVGTTVIPPAIKVGIKTTSASAVTSTVKAQKVAANTIEALEKQIKSFDATVKKTDKSATDKYEKIILSGIKKRTKELLEKVKTGITAEELARLQTKYENLQDELNTIISPQ